MDQYVLRELITEKLPTLSQHMEAHHIEISLFAWFLTVFVDNIPVAVYLHIWDVFLHEGSKVLFRFALAILRMHEAELLQLCDSASFNQFLRTLDERQFNLKRLSEIAFRELNPFSSARVRAKRNHYTALVTEELRKIEQVREAIVVQQHDNDELDARDDHQKQSNGQEGKTSNDNKSSRAEAAEETQTNLINFDDDSD